MTTYPSQYYRDPALNAKLRDDRCDGCRYEKPKYDYWDGSIYYVCLKGLTHGHRCGAYK